MTYEFIVEIAWKSVVTSGLALLLLLALRNRSAGERSWIAHAGLTATLILPLAATLLPRWHVAAPAPLPDAFQSTSALSVIETAPAQVLPHSAPVADGAVAMDLAALPFWIYATIAALLLLFTLVAVLRLFVLRGRAAVLVEPSWLSALAHAQRRMGFKHGTALLVSNELGSPVSWGVLRPIILLNEEAVTSEAEAEAIIAHELAHVAHLDWAKLIVARAATALFWFNPLVWLLARQCHQLREEAADDAVLLGNIPSTDYAALLIGAARHDSKPLLLAANGVAPGRGSLKRRVMRVLDTTLSKSPARIGWGVACSAAAILVAAPLSAITGEAPAPDPAPSYAKPRFEKAAPDPQFVAVAAPAAAATAAPVEAPSMTATKPAQASVQVAAVAEASPAASAPQPVQLAQRGRPLDPDTLISMRIHGVDPDFIREVEALGPKFRNLSSKELVAMRIHGLSADKVRQLSQLGYGNSDFDALISAAVHGVSPAFIQEMAAAGYPGLTLKQLTNMRIHGVSAAFARELNASGKFSADDLVDMKIMGVGPHPRRVSRVRARPQAPPTPSAIPRPRPDMSDPPPPPLPPRD